MLTSQKCKKLAYVLLRTVAVGWPWNRVIFSVTLGMTSKRSTQVHKWISNSKFRLSVSYVQVINVKFHSMVFRVMVFTKKYKRWKRDMMKISKNEGFEREDSPKLLRHFSFWCSDKNGELIEEQNNLGCQYLQEKAKVHFYLQIQVLVCRSMGTSQCALQKLFCN